jgi:hypothetical protein
VRIIKLAILSFIFLFIVLTGITLLIPSDIRLSKVVNIKAPKDSIFHLIKNKEEWARWHPSFRNNNQPGHTPANVKATVVSETDSLLTIQWQTGNSKPINNNWQLHQMGEENDYTLQWFINFHSSWYPWQKLKTLFYENNYGKMMEEGLKNLKAAAEPSPGRF